MGGFRENILNPLKEKFDVDVFVSTWNVLYTKRSMTFIAKNYLGESNPPQDAPMTEQEIEEAKNLYKAETFEVEKHEDVSSIFKINYYNPLKMNPDHFVRGMDGELNYIPMHYKIKKCNELKKQKELKDGFKYDLVVKTRPDLAYFNRINPTLFNERKTVYIENEIRENFCRDLLAAGSSEDMDVYCSLFDDLKFYLNDENYNEESEFVLDNHLKRNKMNVKLAGCHCIVKK